MFFMSSCEDDSPELGQKLNKSAIDFEVVQDYSIDEGGNTVILKNLTPEIVPMWDYGTGRSTRMVDTVRFPFKGEYIIKFSAVTGGGIVNVDAVTIEVTEDNLMYVNDPLWTALTGGVGESKTWILDNGKYGLATGPLSYADPSRAQVWGDYQANWDPADVGQTDADMNAEMTFSLQGGPFIATVKPNEDGGDESGTFSLNTAEHTLSTTDATIIRPAGFIANASNWTENLNVLELNENQLRIAVYRTNDEGPWWYILNYVSKEYAENYVPEFQPDPNFNHGNQMEILAGNSATTWKLDIETPFNWTDLIGVFLNNWYAISDYPEWTGYDANAVANIENIRITFSKTGDVTIVNNDGVTQEGVFSIEENKNLITFEGIKPSLPIGDMVATTTEYKEDDAGNVITGENQWKIVKTKAVGGVVTEVWLGNRNPSKKEYMVYHFVMAQGTPDLKKAITRTLCGGIVGATEKTFKIDINWPVDWTNPEGEGWTVAGTQEDWYWSADIAASVADQRITFSQVEGEITMTKDDGTGNITTSTVTIDAATGTVTIPDANIIQFGAGSWLPTAGPDYKWARSNYGQGELTEFWMGIQSSPTEITAYHYIEVE